MESLSGSQYSNTAAANAHDALRGPRQRMAHRLRSPWWFHVLRGLAVAAIVVGLSNRSPWDLIPLGVGLAGLIALSRHRAQTVGYRRANPDRWQFLRTGAPWSVLSVIVVAAAIAVAVFTTPTVPVLTVVTALTALLVTALSPLADRSARRHLSTDGGQVQRASVGLDAR